MSRGIGKTQQRILDALAASEYVYLTAAELAAALGISRRQANAAAHSLHHRGLVRLRYSHRHWRGVGEYGRLVPRYARHRARHWSSTEDFGPDVPTALVIQPGEPILDQHGRRSEYEFALEPIEYVHAGMPAGRTLCVQLAQDTRPWPTRC